MKTIKLAVIALLSAVLFAACQKEVLEVSLTFSKEQFELTVGEELDLLSELKVENSSESPVFVSLNTKVATVDASGKVVAVAAGEAKVSASIGKKSVRCVIKVAEVVAQTIGLECPSELVAGSESWATVTATVTPASFNLENLKWEFTPSDDLLGFVFKKVSASEYKFQFGSYVENGNVTIKVSDKNSSVAQTVVVAAVAPEPEEVPATRISLEYPKSITEGESVWGTVTAVVTPAEYNPENLTWEFEPNNEEMGFAYEKVSATEYQVKFATYVEGGKVTVTVTDVVSGKFQVATISVEKKPMQGATELVVSPESLQLFTTSDPVVVVVKCTPADYDTALLNWTSSNTEVVTVVNGVVTVVGEGEAVVKAVDSISGLEDEVTIKVGVPAEDAKIASISLSQVNLNMNLSDNAVQLVAECKDSNGDVVENYPDLVWSAEKMQMEIGKVQVVDVTQQGVVTPMNIGTTVITVVDKNNGSVKATCNVVVTGVNPTGITLSPSTLLLPVGVVYSEFAAVVSPDNCDYKDVVWTSSDTNVATVDGDGNVTTLAAGTATITAATTNGAYSAECQIEVKDMSFMISLSLEDDAVGGLIQGSTTSINASYSTLDGSEYTPSETSWASSNTALATVDANGNVMILDSAQIDVEGAEVVITHVADGEAASVTLKIIKAIPTSITISSYPENYKMYVNETFTFGATVFPESADQSTKWQCFCETIEHNGWSYIDLTTGTFTPKEPGSYYIYAFSAYEYRDAYNVIHTFTHIRNSICVEVMPIDIQEASLNHTSLHIYEGNTASLTVNIAPSDATYKDIDWSSSNEDVVVVTSNGILTAVGAGEAVITARQEENDITLTCTVNVTVPVREFSLGDYYYSDGTISSELIQDKTLVGIVCALNDVTGHDEILMADFPACKNGLVMSVAETEATKWQGYGASVSNWAVQNGFLTLAGARSVSGVATDTPGELTTDGEKMRGYNNTKAIKAYMQRDDYESLGDDYAVYLLNGWSEEAPSGTSGWYVPSVAEWIAVSDNAELLQNRLISAGAPGFDTNGYWTSTENDGVGSWAVYMDVLNKKFYANRKKSTTQKVRYVFAF